MSTINRDSAVPLYHQIKQLLLHDIHAGLYGDRQPLPSEKELGDMYGVSRITIRRALSDLTADGYIKREPGRGTFALSPKVRHRSGKIGGYTDDLAAQGFRVTSDVLDYRQQFPTVELAEKLRIPASRRLLFTKQLVRANAEPIALGYAHHNYPDYVSFSREEIGQDSVLNLLRRKYGLVPRHAERVTELAYLADEEARLLMVAPQTAAIQVELTVFDEVENGILHVRSLYRGDRYVYHETIRL